MWRGIEYRWLVIGPIQKTKRLGQKTLFLPIKSLSYSCLVLIRWGASQLDFLIFIEKISLAHHSKKLKLWRLPKLEGSILKCRVPPLWPSYIGERRTTFAKAYGIKVRWYGEHVGEHIGNLETMLGIQWEHIRNTLGTRKNEKNPPSSLLQNLKGKKARPTKSKSVGN